MFCVLKGIHTEAHTAGPSAHAHGGEALHLHRVLQGPIHQTLLAGAHEPAHRCCNASFGFLPEESLWLKDGYGYRHTKLMDAVCNERDVFRSSAEVLVKIRIGLLGVLRPYDAP